MDNVLTRLKAFFFPAAEVPEEEEHHKKASSERSARVQELRAALASDPSLDQKIDGITAQLLKGVEQK